MARFGKTPYYEPGETKCKVSLRQFMEVVLPARLKNAGEDRKIKIDRRGKRMRFLDGRWTDISKFYDEYAAAHCAGQNHGIRIAVFKAMAALRNEQPRCIPGAPGYFPNQIMRGPTYRKPEMP